MDVFVPRFHIIHKNFPGDWTNSSTVTSSICSILNSWRVEFFFEFWKMNETLRILDVFVPRCHITHKNFPGDWTNSCTVISSIFFKSGILKNIKKIEKIRMDSKKSINLFQTKKIIGYLIIHCTIIFFTNLYIFSELLLCKINVLDFSDMDDFFLIFIISRNTQILIESNYRLGMYVPYILNLLM